MARFPSKSLTPISFLQSFICQSARTLERQGGSSGLEHFIEGVGLAASFSLEMNTRDDLGYAGAITPDVYADIIIALKNEIGGHFSRASAEAGSVRIVNRICPFGDHVKEAPELCRMTASVFGGIAARNFGYAKVELKRRIALGHECCEVCVHLDPATAGDRPGDEYHREGDEIVSRSASSEARARVEARLRQVWRPPAADHSGRTRPPPAIVAESASLRAVLEVIETIAPTPATILITGETGVGKEVVARSIHAMSERADRTFLAINCGAIPESLIESTLFGHEKGAFTGAFTVHQGFFERADRGTLLLDEIDSLPVPAQSRLLRVLQEGEFERVGGCRTLRTDVRIIAASNQDLEEAVRRGRFRSDLYYRLKVIPIHIPPLRDRPDDLGPLVRHFLDRLAQKYGGAAKTLDERVWSRIRNYSWPGNLRELENVMERAFLFSRGPVIDRVDVGAELASDADSPLATAPLRLLRHDAAKVAEGKAIADALRQSGGNVRAAARRIGVTPRALHMRLKRLGIAAVAFRGHGPGNPAE